MDFKSVDFNKYKKYLNSQSSADLNRFLEALPHNAGKTVLIAAGIAWGIAAAAGLYASIQAQSLTELRAELKETQALKPAVPTIKNVAIPKAEVERFVTQAKKTYRGIDIKAQGSTIIITASSTSNFAEFREAIGHVQNGGNGWRVTLDKLCVGRECDKRFKLAASLKVNKVSVENPAL
ncbi:MAG: hypothetical protein AAF549_04255 [Pseudomonadota bacterium]